jgi:formate dehydrogenase subunit gamma
MARFALQNQSGIVGRREKRRPRPLLLLGAALFLLVCGSILWEEYSAAAASSTSHVNPRANYWREARDSVKGVTTDQGPEQNVLIQNGGQNWRRVRNGLVSVMSPWVLAGVLGAIAIFFIIVGQDNLEERPTGETMERWSLPARLLHWYTAVLFVLMALTGLSILFGRAVLIPILGIRPFSAYLTVAKAIHNYGGPLFLAGVAVEIVAWIRYNILKKIDLIWFKNLGGIVGKGPRPHAERINGGEKAWFWVMVLAGFTVGVTGVIMDFPNFGASRFAMQVANVIHASAAVLFVTGSFGHIYIGTVGAEGTFAGMWTGRVSIEWARQHQDLWYAEKTAKAAATEAGPDSP